MPRFPIIIHIHPLAPSKPLEGAVCNGCGLCCLAEPCPLGMVLSRRRTGACSALQWNAARAQYRCGAIVAPQSVLKQALPRALRWLARPIAPMLRCWALRWIAAGAGCDSDLESAPSLDAEPRVSTTMNASLDNRTDREANLHD